VTREEPQATAVRTALPGLNQVARETLARPIRVQRIHPRNDFRFAEGASAGRVENPRWRVVRSSPGGRTRQSRNRDGRRFNFRDNWFARYKCKGRPRLQPGRPFSIWTRVKCSVRA